MERYAAQMRAFAEMPSIEIARFQVHRLNSVEPVHDALLKAERSTPQHTLKQVTEPASNKPGAPRRFKEEKPALTRVTGRQAASVLGALEPYRAMLEPQRQHFLSFYRPVDVAFKVVGTGSVGLRDYCICFEGNGPGDPLFLQMKEEKESSYAPYLPNAQPARHNGQRVVEGHRAMQLQSDPFLGWTQFGGRDYLVRQLNDHKGPINIDDMAGGGLRAFRRGVRGTAGARPCPLWRPAGHLRLSGFGDGFAEALAKFGSLYADQTEKDWEDLCASAKAGAKPAKSKSTKS